jgi:hypothetical protein
VLVVWFVGTSVLAQQTLPDSLLEKFKNLEGTIVEKE